MRHFFRLVCIVFVASAACAAHAQSQWYHRITRNDAEYEERLRALRQEPPPRPIVTAEGRGLLTVDFPDVGQATGSGDRGLLFGSFGQSLRTSVGRPFMLSVEVRRVGLEHSFWVDQHPALEASLLIKSIGRKLESHGLHAGDMRYGVFAVDLQPGQYEIREFVMLAPALNGGNLSYRVNKFEPLRFEVMPGGSTYMGRLSLVPVPVHLTAEQSSVTGSPRPEDDWMRTPEQRLGGFKIWVQDARDDDASLVAPGAGNDSRRLAPAIAALVPGLTTTEVSDDMLDHRLAWRRWLENQSGAKR